MNYGCEGLIAVISGGTSGIGLATAEKLLLEGVVVYILGRSYQKGVDAVAYLKEKTGKEAIYVPCNVMKAEDCQSAIDKIYGHLSTGVVAPEVRIDILINSAGIYKEKRLEQVSDRDYSQMFDTNVKGMVFLTQAVLAHMQKGGSIVNIASDAGISGNYGCPLYCASKGAVVALTKALALDLAPKIRVNCVCPADVDTPLLEEQLKNNGGGYTKEDMYQDYPLGRIARAEEIAHVIMSVVSPQNSFMTGSIISVDGGLNA